MDSLSHALVGLTLSRLDGARDLGAVAAVTLTTASLLPDIDVASRAFGSRSYLRHHRGITHALAFLPIEAAALSGVLMAFWPAARAAGFTTLFLLSLGAMVVHILFDVLTPYGTKVLLPFHSHPIAADSMPIFDPFLIVFTTLGLVFSYRNAGRAHAAALVILAVWVAFFLLYGLSKRRSAALARWDAGSGRTDPDTFPVPGMPPVWLCVVRRRGRYETFFVNVLTGKKKHHHFFRSHPFPKELEHHRTAKVFHRFARHSLVEKKAAKGLRHYTIRDLRFDFPYRRRFFVWKITLDRRGRIVRDHFRL